jgi:hypothetical protein
VTSDAIPMYLEVCVDWDGNGNFTTSGDDISAYVHGVGTASGVFDDLLMGRISAIGNCTISLNNTDRRFTPLNADSPYFGKMIPNKEVRVRITDGTTTWPVFRGYAWSFTPEGGGVDEDGPIEGFTCELQCRDEMIHLQDEVVHLPTLENILSSRLVSHIINSALHAPQASRTNNIDAQPANNDTLIIGDGTNLYTFTFVTTLTTSNQVLRGANLTEALTNIKDAINQGDGAGTRYSSVMTMPRFVTARAEHNISYSETNINTDVLLRHNVSTKDKLAQSFKVPTVVSISAFGLRLKKVGSPTGTLTLRIETSDLTNPTGALVIAEASATFSEASLSTSYQEVQFVMEYVPLVPGESYWLVLSTDRAASGTNYVAWGADSSAPSYADGEMRSLAGAVWSAESKDAAFNMGSDKLVVTSVLPGAIGNQYNLANTGVWTVDNGGNESILTDGGNNPPIGDQAGTVYIQAQSVLNTYNGLLEQLVVSFGANINAPTGNVKLKLVLDFGGEPDYFNVIMETTFQPDPGFNVFVPLTASVTMSDATIYWFVIEVEDVQATDDAFTWRGDTNDIYANGNRSYSTDGGFTWTPDFSYDLDIQYVVTDTLFSGGQNYPFGNSPSIETGVNTFQYAGDTWDERTNAMSALQQVIDSEWGSILYVDRDGAFKFKNRHLIFTKANESPDLITDNDHSGISATSTADQIFNRIEVIYTPLATLTSGVIAESKNTIAAPGRTGLTERWNPSQTIRDQPGTVVAKLPFIDPATGDKISALSVITPLVPSTDWTANEDPSFLGVDYTFFASLSFSVAIVGGNAEVTITNTALGPLFIRLKVRGVGLHRYNPESVVVEDADSQELYKLIRTFTVTLPFSASSPSFPRNLADYLLSRYKDPAFRVSEIVFREINVVNDVNLFSLTVGDTIRISDYQAGVEDDLYLITGVRYPQLTQYSTGEIAFKVFALGDLTYWLLGIAGFGELDQTTRLGI